MEQLLDAIDSLDVDGVVALLAPDIRLLTADGRRAQGVDAARELLQSFLAVLRSTTHEVTAQWHVDDVWIAEVQASYELRDWLELTALPRAFIARQGSPGISELRVYGAHEHPLTDEHTELHSSEPEGVWMGGRFVPPL